MSNPVLQAAIDGLTDAIVNAVAVQKKHEALVQSLVDTAEVELADAKLKVELGVLISAGISGLLTAVKSIPADVAGDLELLPEVILDSQKLLAAFKA